MPQKKFVRTLGLLMGAALLVCALSPAQAALVYDVRFDPSDISGGVVSEPGQQVVLDLYAQVTGSDSSPTALEGFQEGYGSILGTVSNGSITGTLSATLASPFADKSSQAGHPNDLTSDAVIDIGSSLTTPNADFVFARAKQMQTTGGTAIAGGMEFKIATITFTLDATVPPDNGATLNIKFLVTQFTGLTNFSALWMEDNAFKTSSAGGNGLLPTSTGGVTIVAVPEPSSALLLGLGVLAACSRRRRTA